jgi:hypothetical protein
MKHIRKEASLVEVKVFKHRQTERAVQLEAIETPTGAHWFPLSQIELSGVDEGQNIYVMSCPTWLATEKGFC